MSRRARSFDKLLSKFLDWRARNGNRKSGQAGDDSSEDDPGAYYSGYQAAIDALAQKSADPGGVGPMAVPIFAPGMAMKPGAVYHAQTPITAAQVLAASYAFNSGSSRCDKCGAAYRTDAGHECVLPSDHDREVVSTIQLLASHGLSPQEIADDMGLVLGWREWGVRNMTLCGAGVGEDVLWRMDAPMTAVCADIKCCGDKARCDGRSVGSPRNPGAPICRIHAVKKPILKYIPGFTGVPGAVALWGEVITCEQGYLATRAYPLGFRNEGLARMYRVPHITEEIIP